MESTLTKHERNLSALIHASTFSKFVVPFGNFIIPLVLWTANKNDYAFVDHNGKQALNFQMSMLLYSVILGAISIPFLVGFFPELLDFGLFGLDQLSNYNDFSINLNTDNFKFGSWLIPLSLAGLAKAALFIVNVVYTLLATIKTNEGQYFEYPLTIKFIK